MESEELEKEEKEKQEEEVEFLPLSPEQEFVDEEEGLTDEQTDKILAELKTGERNFELNGVNYKIVNPNVRVAQQADWEYSKVFNEALEIGLPLQEDLEKTLVAKKLIPSADEFESFSKKTRNEIERLETKLKLLLKTDNEAEKKRIATKLAKVRANLYTIITRRMSYLNNSVESKADDARNSFLISKCAYNADTNIPVWSSYEEYLNETNRVLLNKISYEFVSFTTGVGLNFLQEFPENKVLGRVE